MRETVRTLSIPWLAGQSRRQDPASARRCRRVGANRCQQHRIDAAYRKLGGDAEIVLLPGLGKERENSRGHDGHNYTTHQGIAKFLLAD